MKFEIHDTDARTHIENAGGTAITHITAIAVLPKLVEGAIRAIAEKVSENTGVPVDDVIADARTAVALGFVGIGSDAHDDTDRIDRL